MASSTSEHGSASPVVVLDGHVHLYPTFELAEFFRAAAESFGRAILRRRANRTRDAVGVLFLVEEVGDACFERLRGETIGGTTGWHVTPTLESVALRAEPPGGLAAPTLFLISGRQVRTRDGLEVLVHGAEGEWRDGDATTSTIEAAVAAGALATVPWGFGKWWLGRGRLVGALLETCDPAAVFLGDNGGRPRWLPPPRQFAAARKRGVRVLPGSDPLPFARAVARVGSCGTLLRAAIDPERPTASLFAALRDPTLLPLPYGSGPSPIAFVRDQLAMQTRRLRRADPRERHRGEDPPRAQSGRR